MTQQDAPIYQMVPDSQSSWLCSFCCEQPAVEGDLGGIQAAKALPALLTRAVVSDVRSASLGLGWPSASCPKAGGFPVLLQGPHASQCLQCLPFPLQAWAHFGQGGLAVHV